MGTTNLDTLALAGDLTVAGTETITGGVTYAGNVTLGDTSADAITVTGTMSTTTPVTITSLNANALAVGRLGATNPTLKINSATASSITGIEIIAAATGGNVQVNAIGGTNESLILAGKGTGAVHLGQATSTDVRLVADQPIADSSGNELIKFVKTASAINEITITNQSVGLGPQISATGGDTNINVTLAGKGTGSVILGQATSTGVSLAADQPITDSSNNELIKFTKATNAVNEFTIANAATNNLLSLTATGSDSNVGFVLAAKGSAGILVRSSLSVKQGAVTAKTTSATLTAAELVSGIITVNQGGGATSAQQLPTASDLDSLLNAFAPDDAFDFSVINTSTVDAEDASVTTNTGWTLVGNMDIHAYSAAGSLNSSAHFRARKTGSAAWTLYRIA